MPTTTRPNVLVFLADQLRWDCSSLHGNPLDLMPNFDRLAQAGVHVAHCYSCQPVCGPARACLQTGTYATVNGSWRNSIPLNPELPNLATTFAKAGYHTGYIGKWHLADVKIHGPVAPEQRGGYQEWLASNILEFTSDAYRTCLYDNDGKEHFLPGYRIDAQTDAVIRFLHRRHEQPDKPFFLFNSYIEPHHQNSSGDYPAPDGYETPYRGRWMPPDLAALKGDAHQHLAGYYGTVKRLDEALGRILDALKSMGMLENTIILFSADHGSHFATRNGEYKRSCHDSSIRVPTALSGPGFDGGGRVRELVSMVDLPVTLLDAAGLEVPETMQGRSLMPLLRREPVEWPKEIFTQISESEVGRAIRTERWKYAVVAPDKNGGRDSCSEEYVESHLYDVASDPYELRNLAGMKSHRGVADELMARLLERMRVDGKEGPVRIVPAEERKSGQLLVTEGPSRHRVV